MHCILCPCPSMFIGEDRFTSVVAKVISREVNRARCKNVSTSVERNTSWYSKITQCAIVGKAHLPSTRDFSRINEVAK